MDINLQSDNILALAVSAKQMKIQKSESTHNQKKIKSDYNES